MEVSSIFHGNCYSIAYVYGQCIMIYDRLGVYNDIVQECKRGKKCYLTAKVLTCQIINL